MRSELVYLANNKVRNRFQLCCLASSSARRMNQNSVSMHTTINRALMAISTQSAVFVIEPLPVDEAKPQQTPTLGPPVFGPAI
jgi:hypothetical protein